MSFIKTVNKLIQEAPAVQSSTNVNFGPLEVTPIIVRFAGKGNKPEKVTLADYMAENGIKDGEEFELDDRETFQLRFVIGVDELNPALNFKYEREVAVLASNEKVKTDWEATVLPSLIKVFGRDWHTKLLPNGKRAAPVVYVSAENADSLRVARPQADGTPGRNYGVPKFLAVYADLEECREARDKRYPPRDDAEAMAFPPDDDEEGDDNEVEYSEDQKAQAITLYNSAKKNRKQTITMLKKMFPKVEDAGDLLDSALAEEEDE